MKKIVFEEYESFLEQIQHEDQSNQDCICIDFQSLVDHLETIEQCYKWLWQRYISAVFCTFHIREKRK